ncbi:hypothetical protein [Methylobacterium symbioticum]|uniref:Uncharacterized protein n=1 Tax=Methylobacterium symbioticum TaxID=2584084 RepID=A0A509E808_9HYPH|nr:hypothetical protein [Methylobacterium symbioticum]VUD70386.1 hypothetical protein MET9862_00952 [Methylobacterium symbioticum]
MEPMKPMAPIKMAPMRDEQPWWDSGLGEPATSGSQNGLRYAFFPERRRLLVEKDGRVTAYDSGERHIDGVSQQSGGSVTFRDQNGEVDLDALTVAR